MDERGYTYDRLIVTFAVEKAWRGLPKGAKEYRVATNATSCGYGGIIAPYHEENLMHGTFAIFAKGPELTICNSLWLDEAYLVRHPNPFTSLFFTESPNQTLAKPVAIPPELLTGEVVNTTSKLTADTLPKPENPSSSSAPRPLTPGH